jgi:dihydroxyacetone kinase-like predicted kinase
MHIHTYTNLKLYTASMYFDIEDQIENNFEKMDEILRFAADRRVLIAAYSNARSKTWHNVKTNLRGQKME